MMKERQSNIELLRIFAMLGVVFMHFNGEPGMGFDYVLQGSINHYLLLLLESMAICAVNLFVLITGYFSVTTQKRKLSKAFCLILQVSLFRLGYTVLAGVLWNGISLRGIVNALIPVNYFVVLYVAVYLLSPYLNLLLQKLTDSGRIRLLILSLILFSAWPSLVDVAQTVLNTQFPGLSTIGLDGSGSGYTLVNFLLMYLIGGVLRLNAFSWRKRKAGTILAGCVALIAVWSIWMPGSAWSYCNPLVILSAVSLFLFFQNLSFNSRIVNTLSSGAFTCYLMHTYLVPFVDVKSAVRGNPMRMVLILALAAGVIYIISWLCGVVYGLLEKPIQMGISRLTKGLDLNVEDAE